MRAQASRAPCAQANEPRLRSPWQFALNLNNAAVPLPLEKVERAAARARALVGLYGRSVQEVCALHQDATGILPPSIFKNPFEAAAAALVATRASFSADAGGNPFGDGNGNPFGDGDGATNPFDDAAAAPAVEAAAEEEGEPPERCADDLRRVLQRRTEPEAKLYLKLLEERETGAENGAARPADERKANPSAVLRKMKTTSGGALSMLGKALSSKSERGSGA